MHKRLLLPLLSSLLLAFVLLGCGGGAEDGDAAAYEAVTPERAQAASDHRQAAARAPIPVESESATDPQRHTAREEVDPAPAQASDYGYAGASASSAGGAEAPKPKPRKRRDPDSLRALERGDCGTDVENLNENLAERRFLPRGFSSRCFTEETYHGVVAFQKWYGLERTGEVPGRLREMIRRKPMPRLEKRVKGSKIIISLRKQTLVEVRRGKIMRILPVSTAAPGYSTPTGTFSVYRKEEMSWSVPYKVWLPWASYIYGGIAMHAYPSVPTYPASHGCIRIPEPFAKQLYRFARYGMTVNVV